MQTQYLKLRAHSLLRAEGFDWEDLEGRAKEIVVFGSYACGAQSKASDLDLMLVGKGKQYKSKKLHLIWVKESCLHDQKWLGSELATHVARYGRWIKGRGDWAKRSAPSFRSIQRKKRRILDRLEALQDEWEQLLPFFRRKQLVRLRRDVQRLAYLRKGTAVVPSSILDKQWKMAPNNEKDLSQLFKNELQLKNRIMSVLHANPRERKFP